MKMVPPFIVNDAALLTTNVPENEYDYHSMPVTYALGDRVTVVTTNNHAIYESLQNGNIGHLPETSPTWWTKLSFPTNPWRMFDYSVSSQTTNPDTITATVKVSKRADTAAFLNVEGTAVNLTITNDNDDVLFDKTVSLIDNSGINTWHSYFFQPRDKTRDVVMTGLPLNAGLNYTVTVLNYGGVAACGVALFGLSKDLGCTLYGASVGIDDYSIKKKDEFGNTTLKEREFSKNGSFNIGVEKCHASKLPAFLSNYRATPVLYLGTEEYEGTFILGFYSNFKQLFAGWDDITCSIEIEGLT